MLHTVDNTGYITGSINGVFENYDLLLEYECVIHMHADVFPIDENTIFELLKKFYNSDSCFLATYTGVQNNLEQEIQSDLYFFKPKKINRDFFATDSSGICLEQLIYKRIIQYNINCFRVKRYDTSYTSFHALDKIGFWHCHNLQDIYNFLESKIT